jgi:hypothetical protein
VSETSIASASIDLAQPRVIVLQGPRELRYELTCRRALKDDWLAYYAALTVTSQREGRDMVNVFDVDTPRRILAERLITSVKGYHVDGGQPLDSLPGWQKRLPLAHRLKAGQILSSVNVEDRFDEMIYPGGDPVSIDAIWTAGEDGAMQRIDTLTHVVKLPSDAQQRSYTRAASRTVILGGDRAGTTVYPGCQELLASLYDELIVSVTGYTVNGQQLGDPATIAKEMDMHHKVVVAQQIFAPRVQVIASEGSAAA